VPHIPVSKAIGFVRYLPSHDVPGSLVVNESDLTRARAWVVYDRAADNARRLALAPERTT
jgi:hypothetical protein